jgi:hypothetical protein
MTKSIKKTYHWKRLTEDGLLKEPKDLSHGYTNLNNWGGGYDSEEEAQATLLELDESYSYDLWYDKVLITIYNVVEEE